METLLVAAFANLLVALTYGYVGAQMTRRQASDEGRLAVRLFAVWWYGLAGVTALVAVQDVLAAFGVTALAAYLTIQNLVLTALSVALFGLLYYLAYLFTGSRAILAPLVAFYAALYVGLVYVVAYREPVAVTVESWRVVIDYAHALDPVVGIVLVALLVGPHIVGALAYFSLFFRLRDRTQRYRIGMVALSIGGWFTSSLVASLVGASQLAWWPLVSLLIGFLGALLVAMAYAPPRFMRERFGLASI